jgi:hypothetical protein
VLKTLLSAPHCVILLTLRIVCAVLWSIATATCNHALRAYIENHENVGAGQVLTFWNNSSLLDVDNDGMGYDVYLHSRIVEDAYTGLEPRNNIFPISAD